MFWTIAIPDSAVDTHPGSGRARLHVSGLSLVDAFNVPNALFGDPSTHVPATGSFDIRWLGGEEHVKVRDRGNDFGGQFVPGPATIEWTASNAQGFSFVSDPAGAATSTSLFGYVGHERNGVFFR